MTYNFDPDRWYEMQRNALTRQLEDGELDEEEYQARLEELDRRLEELLDRLDGSFRIPGVGEGP